MDLLLTLFDYITKIGGFELNLFFFNVGLDKFIHIGMILFIGTVLHFIKINTKTILLILLIVSFGKEFFDLFIRNTFFSFGDIIADMIGIIIISILYHLKD